VLIVMVALLAGFIQAAGADAKVRKGPSGLAFYDPPKHFPKGTGKAIWARKAGGLVPLENAAKTKLILYTSTDPHGDRTAVSGSVSVPRGKPPKGGWPLITYAHGTTGVADVCAPSRNATGGPVVPYVSYVDPQLNEWLDAGYAIARTDFQGLGTPGPHPYLIGKAEGDDVIDIAKASRKLHLKVGKRYLIAGHSQGAHAALFAAGEAKKEAPGLKLRGTTAYAPPSHLLEQAKLLPALTTPSGLSALATLILYGATTASDDVVPAQLLAPEALAFYPELETTCLPQLGAANKLGGIAPADLIRDGADPTPLYNALATENPLVKSKAPIFIAQGTADTTVFPFLTDQLSGELTSAGDKLNYKKYPGVSHASIVSAAETDALAFFQSRLPASR
jgi:hypothetical protein